MKNLANILAAMVFFLTLFMCLCVVLAVVAPDTVAQWVPKPTNTPLPTNPPPTLVAVAQVPTNTPLPTKDPLQPTFTPPVIEEILPTATPTRRPTLTPSITSTLPPATPTRTPSATPTLTPSPGPSPTATYTRSPFPFNKSIDSPLYIRNFANTAGCNWMGVAGEVQDLNGGQVAAGQYRIHVYGSGIDARVNAGSATAYGQSGWEQFLLDKPEVRTYNVQLETSSGTAVSQAYQFQTRASCNENLVYIIFQQNR